LLEIEYCELKLFEPLVMRVTFTVPFPESVPLPFNIANESGVTEAFDETLNVLEELKFLFTVNPLVLLIVILLKEVVADVVPTKVVAAGVTGVLKMIVLEVLYENGVPADELFVQFP
jgi:hypothetical protein